MTFPRKNQNNRSRLVYFGLTRFRKIRSASSHLSDEFNRAVDRRPHSHLERCGRGVDVRAFLCRVILTCRRYSLAATLCRELFCVQNSGTPWWQYAASIPQAKAFESSVGGGRSSAFRGVARGWAMLTHTPVAAIEARELLRPLIVGITGGNLFERSLAQESICTRCQFSQTTSGLVAVHSGCCLSSSSSFSCCVADARRKGGTFLASVPLLPPAAAKRRLVPISRTACGARSRCSFPDIQPAQ